MTKNTPTSLYTDESKLNQIPLKICTNAYKFTEKGSIKIDVHSTKLLKEKHQFQFKITDTGRGI